MHASFRFDRRSPITKLTHSATRNLDAKGLAPSLPGQGRPHPPSSTLPHAHLFDLDFLELFFRLDDGAPGALEECRVSRRPTQSRWFTTVFNCELTSVTQTPASTVRTCTYSIFTVCGTQTVELYTMLPPIAVPAHHVRGRARDSRAHALQGGRSRSEATRRPPSSFRLRSRSPAAVVASIDAPMSAPRRRMSSADARYFRTRRATPSRPA